MIMYKVIPLYNDNLIWNRIHIFKVCDNFLSFSGIAVVAEEIKLLKD